MTAACWLRAGGAPRRRKGDCAAARPQRHGRSAAERRSHGALAGASEARRRRSC
uniref:Uncharacterized protein n=1 Tax=Setaria italica TaxID=4555 RepID=K3Z1R4_SETIT